MQNHLPSGKLQFVGGWQPADDPEIVVLLWETRSITPEIESSLYTAEVIRDTQLIDVMSSGSLDGLRSRLRERYGDPEAVDPERDVFAAAAQCRDEELVEV